MGDESVCSTDEPSSAALQPLPWRSLAVIIVMQAFPKPYRSIHKNLYQNVPVRGSKHEYHRANPIYIVFLIYFMYIAALVKFPRQEALEIQLH